MNNQRIVVGPFLAIIFLTLFVYGVFWIQPIFNLPIFDNYSHNSLGSISDGIDQVIPIVQEVEDSIINNETPENNEPVIENIPVAIIEDQEEEKLTINARSAISVESNLYGTEKVFFEKNSETQLPIASLTKLMTAIIVLDTYDLSDKWIISENANKQSPIKQDVSLGDTLTINDLLSMTLIASSNKSAYALSEIIGEDRFVNLMNNKATELGLYKTFFVDPTGLSPNNVSTAKDLVKLTEHILKKYPKISEISQSKKIYIAGVGEIINTDLLLNNISGVVCSKTGFTNLAKGCLLLATSNSKNNNYLINIVLGSDDRFVEMQKLVNWSNKFCQ